MLWVSGPLVHAIVPAFLRNFFIRYKNLIRVQRPNTRMNRFGDPWVLLAFRKNWLPHNFMAPIDPQCDPVLWSSSSGQYPYLGTRNNLGSVCDEIDAQPCLDHVASNLTTLQSRMGPRRFLRLVSVLVPLDLEHWMEFISGGSCSHPVRGESLPVRSVPEICKPTIGGK